MKNQWLVTSDGFQQVDSLPTSEAEKMIARLKLVLGLAGFEISGASWIGQDKPESITCEIKEIKKA